MSLKRPAERPEAGEADIEADVGNAAIGFAQQEHRAFDSPPLQVVVRRLAEYGAKRADEVRLGHVRDRRDGTYVEWLGIRAIHGVAGAEQAPVQVLGFTAHSETLRHRATTRFQTDGLQASRIGSGTWSRCRSSSAGG